MSRELKFRAWLKPRWEDDEDANQMYYDIQNSYDNLGDVKPFDPMCNFSDWFRDDIAVVEQYTGLKDKNGREIYEGDIVALLFGYVPMKSVTTENIRIENAQKAVIHFDTARAAFRYTIKLRTPKDCQFKPGTKTNMVVIGNIHENPELLGGEE